MLNTTSPLSIGPTRSQVAVLSYASDASLNFNLNAHRHKESLIQALNDLPYSNDSDSDVAAALNLLYSSYIDGSLKARASHDLIAVLCTNGLPHDFDSTTAIANVLHAETDIKLYVVETSSTMPVNAGYTEIASDPEFVFSATNFSKFQFQRTTELIVQTFDTNLPKLCSGMYYG